MVVPSFANIDLYLDQVGFPLELPSCGNLNLNLDQLGLAVLLVLF